VCFNNASDHAFSEEAADFTFPHGPGILYELWRLTKGTGYVLRHQLAVKFGTHNYTYFIDTTASMCWPPTKLIQQGRKIAALLYFRQCILLSSVVCPWHPGWLEMTAVKTSTWLQSPSTMSNTSGNEDNRKFICQQGVHRNYNTQCLLLSSKNGVKIREMSIIFITFLPP
jgi:hypothetical protein